MGDSVQQDTVQVKTVVGTSIVFNVLRMECKSSNIKYVEWYNRFQYKSNKNNEEDLNL